METVSAPPRRRWRRIAFVVAFTAFVGAWTFAFWYDATRPAPEPLDAASMRAATAACSTASRALVALTPLPAGIPSLSERAARVRSEDAVLVDLVAALGAIHPTDHDGAEALEKFTADWQHLTASRARYAGALLAGQDQPKLIIPVDPTGAPVTIRMREYAEIHHLTGCTPNALQGEVVEGPRTYPPGA
jgi:hypothetical protein